MDMPVIKYNSKLSHGAIDWPMALICTPTDVRRGNAYSPLIHAHHLASALSPIKPSTFEAGCVWLN